MAKRRVIRPNATICVEYDVLRLEHVILRTLFSQLPLPSGILFLFFYQLSCYLCSVEVVLLPLIVEVAALQVAGARDNMWSQTDIILCSGRS